MERDEGEWSFCILLCNPNNLSHQYLEGGLLCSTGKDTREKCESGRDNLKRHSAEKWDSVSF